MPARQTPPAAVAAQRPSPLQLDFFAPDPPAELTLEVPAADRRRLLLRDQLICYRLVRARRRSIGLLIDTQGLTVRAPMRTALAEIERVLIDKADWIVRKLADARQRQQQQHAQQLVWADGLTLSYLGQTLQLRLGPGPLAAPVTILRHGRDRIGLRLQSVAAASQLPPGGAGAPGAPSESAILWVGVGANAAAAELQQLVTTWMQLQARALFEQRLAVYAAPLGVRWTRLALTNARTRWGSATSAGHIRLNWRLLQLPLPIIDYVVAHELSHLRVMDHSPRFWQTVASVMPDYAARRAALKQVLLPDWG